ncbi:CD99 antigen-like protein 2 [Nothoprocta perdicaria]|uniref:CD99 antigen-like protein 2 n=1 Tax=Nothoprocta perdicaria TaxID=30464 RepID=UPI000E1B86C9|nr:CD99 antigen-like protein 2 [Nothoprocta perdicaria]
MAARRLLGLLAAAALLAAGHGDSLDDFNLEDALDDLTTRRPATPKGPRKPAGGSDFSLWDAVLTTTTRRPKTTRAPPKRDPAKGAMDLDLADALDDSNDRKGAGEKPNIKPGEAFSDDDLASVIDGGYNPDRKGGGGGSTEGDHNTGNVAETGTIAGIASALAMALIGAVSSYISYQQKKFCFSIQQGLNAEYVKGENMEAVVSEEPQVKYLALETQSAEPPKQDGAKL